MSVTAIIAAAVMAQDFSSIVKKFSTEKKPQILLLGTYHFANPQADFVKTDLDDHLSEKRQQEIELVRQALVRFEPTVVALEWPKSEQAEFDAQYGSYLKGEMKPTANERVQLGFEIAKRTGLKSVAAIDFRLGMNIESVIEFGMSHGLKSDVDQFMAVTGEVGSMIEKLQNESTVAGTLRVYNSPEFSTLNEAFYLRFIDFATGEEARGAEVLADWHKRNLVMMSYIRQLCRNPEERVLVVLGASHTAFMRLAWANSLDVELVDPLEYLPR